LSSLEGIARELRQRADRVDAIGDQLTRAAANALWTSIAADAFRGQVARRRRDCADVAGMLRSAATNVLRFSHDARAERARLLRLAETAVHDVEAAAAWVGGLL
jgi:hypothetical protein